MKMSDIRRICVVVETIKLSNVDTDVTDDTKPEPATEIAAKSGNAAIGLCVFFVLDRQRSIYRGRLTGCVRA
jgi:hypothetical protein